MDQLDRALRELRTRRRQRVAVLLINLDRFKLVNDTPGHTAADELIVRRRMPAEREFYISMNVSAAALRDRELAAHVGSTLEETGVSSQLVKFELTEGGLINEPVAAREVRDTLHRLGIEMMLDDFGTGYSSLSYLQLFPFDYVKIDEIVETEAAAQDLERMGCDYAQGYYYCEPLEAEEALQVLRTYNAATKRTRAVPEGAHEQEHLVPASTDSVEDTLILPRSAVQARLRGGPG